MAWQIELSEGAGKNLNQLGHQNALRILSFLHGRVGNYRIIADIEDSVMRVFVLKVGNRREVYKK